MNFDRISRLLLSSEVQVAAARIQGIIETSRKRTKCDDAHCLMDKAEDHMSGIGDAIEEINWKLASRESLVLLQLVDEARILAHCLSLSKRLKVLKMLDRADAAAREIYKAVLLERETCQ